MKEEYERCKEQDITIFFLSKMSIFSQSLSAVRLFSDCVFQARDSEIARHMKEEHERAMELERNQDLQRYEEMVRYQQELEKQLEVKYEAF